MVSVVTNARRLRRDQTDAERALWFQLRDSPFGGIEVRRQAPIARYMSDFCCEESHARDMCDARSACARRRTPQ